RHIPEKNGNGIVFFVHHSEVLYSIAVKISSRNPSRIGAHWNCHRLLKRAVTIAEEHVHLVCEGITSHQIVASAVRECRGGNSGMRGGSRSARTPQQRNGRTRRLRKCSMAAALVQQTVTELSISLTAARSNEPLFRKSAVTSAAGPFPAAKEVLGKGLLAPPGLGVKAE